MAAFGGRVQPMSFHRLVELEFPPNPFDPERPHAAAASLVHLNSVPSVQMRCIMTAKRRASATIALFIPRCLAIFIAQALSQDHFAERNSMTWAATLRNFGLKVGVVGTVKFEARIKELVEINVGFGAGEPISARTQ